MSIYLHYICNEFLEKYFLVDSVHISMCVYIVMDNRLKTMNSIRYELVNAGGGYMGVTMPF